MKPGACLTDHSPLQVRCGSLVLDPFAGTGMLHVDVDSLYLHNAPVGGCGLTGSVLVACAHFGAHVVGADIGWKVVHGKGSNPTPPSCGMCVNNNNNNNNCRALEQSWSCQRAR